MSLRHLEASGAGHRRLMRMLLGSTAVVLVFTIGIAGAGAETGGKSDGDAALIADAKRVELAVVIAYNERKWDELGAGLTWTTPS